MERPTTQLRELLEELLSPSSRRRRHLRRRLEAIPGELLQEAITETFLAALLDGDLDAFWVCGVLLEESQRRTEGEGLRDLLGDSYGPFPDEP